MSINHSRRGFFLKFATFVGAALVVPGVLTRAGAQERRRGGGKPGGPAETPFLNPTESAAVAVNYVEDKNKAKAALKTDRQGVKFNDQHCKNCTFYKDTGKNAGTCQIFPGKLVKADAWCSTWNKKA